MKLSVIHDVPQFQTRGTKRSYTFYATTASGVSTFTYATPHDMSYYFRVGDILKLGPSTHTDSIGQYEYITLEDITPTSSNVVTPNANLLYSYNADDPIVGVGTSCPHGWVPADGGGDPTWFLGVAPKELADGRLLPSLWGDNHGVMWFSKPLPNSTATYAYLEARMRKPYLNSTTYRVGVYAYMLSPNSDADIDIQVRCYSKYEWGVSNSDIFSAASYGVNLGGAFSGWSKNELIMTSPSTQDYTGSCVFILMNQLAEFYRMGLTTPYVTHATMTSGEASGAYTIPMNPAKEVQKTYKDRKKTTKHYNGNISGVGSIDSRPIITYNMTFEDADASVVKDLETLQYWQDKGELLLFEPDNDERPIIGRMTFDLQYKHWDLGLITINMKFTEV